jgi:hypothetical protein
MDSLGGRRLLSRQGNAQKLVDFMNEYPGAFVNDREQNGQGLWVCWAIFVLSAGTQRPIPFYDIASLLDEQELWFDPKIQRNRVGPLSFKVNPDCTLPPYWTKIGGVKTDIMYNLDMRIARGEGPTPRHMKIRNTLKGNVVSEKRAHECIPHWFTRVGSGPNPTFALGDIFMDPVPLTLSPARPSFHPYYFGSEPASQASTGTTYSSMSDISGNSTLSDSSDPTPSNSSPGQSASPPRHRRSYRAPTSPPITHQSTSTHLTPAVADRAVGPNRGATCITCSRQFILSGSYKGNPHGAKCTWCRNPSRK